MDCRQRAPPDATWGLGCRPLPRNMRSASCGRLQHVQHLFGTDSRGHSVNQARPEVQGMTDEPDPRLLGCFVAVAEELHITRAAAAGSRSSRTYGHRCVDGAGAVKQSCRSRHPMQDRRPQAPLRSATCRAGAVRGQEKSPLVARRKSPAWSSRSPHSSLIAQQHRGAGGN